MTAFFWDAWTGLWDLGGDLETADRLVMLDERFRAQEHQ